MRKKVLVSCGPIPAKIDSVKYLTNRFKGGLTLRATPVLRGDFDVELVKWKGTDLATDLPVHSIDDVYEYYEFVKEFQADAYVLAGAVANLAPVSPWKGKFPSHMYKEGDVFDIAFTIAPRIIDRVKEWHPRSTLIGYKLFDGSNEELMDAGWETLTHSRANVVFANHPARAKLEKMALMADGTHMHMSFDEHVAFIKRVINLEWYRTEVVYGMYLCNTKKLNEYVSRIVVQQRGYSFGTVAQRLSGGFLTTTRGKRADGTCMVVNVDHENRIVRADGKATLNAPVLDALFKAFPDVGWIFHGHRQLPNCPTYSYVFSGTSEETPLAFMKEPRFNVENHGYYACFVCEEEIEVFLEKYYGY